LALRAHGPNHPPAATSAESNRTLQRVARKPASTAPGKLFSRSTNNCVFIYTLARQIRFRNKIPPARVQRLPVLTTTFGDAVNRYANHDGNFVLVVPTGLRRQLLKLELPMNTRPERSTYCEIHNSDGF